MSYSSILVPFDGSDFAGAALPLATSIGARAGAPIRLVGVHPGLPPSPSGEAPEPLVRASREQAERLREALEGQVESLRGRGVDAESRLLKGPVVEHLVDQAREADLVVMATHGRGGFSRFWLGSVADGLVRRSPVPVLLVRPRDGGDETPREAGRESGGAEWEPGHMLVPLDGSEPAEEALETATELGGLFGARYTLLRVVLPVMTSGFSYGDFPEGVDLTVTETLEDEAVEYLDEVAGRLRGRGLSVETRVVGYPDAASAVREVAEEEDVDLVAMATRGRGGLQRLLLGSVADKVVRTAPVPVLLRRPEGEG